LFTGENFCVTGLNVRRGVAASVVVAVMVVDGVDRDVLELVLVAVVCVLGWLAWLDGPESELSTSRYAKLAKCSLDTALRDIKDLVDAGIMLRGTSGGRSTKYSLAP
jgi:hypothetical protein